MARKQLGTMLIEAGVLTEDGLRAALGEQKRWGGALGRTLVEMKFVSEAELVRVLALQLNLPTIDLDTLEIAAEVTELVPGELAEQHSVVPFAQPMKFLDVAMADPTNLGIIDELRIRTQLNIRSYLAGPKAIERAIGKYYRRGFARFQRRDAGVPLDTPDTLPLAPARELRLHQPPPARVSRDAEIDALQERISQLETRVVRDEGVLRKVLALLVDKQVATRDEIIERLR